MSDKRRGAHGKNQSSQRQADTAKNCRERQTLPLHPVPQTKPQGRRGLAAWYCSNASVHYLVSPIPNRAAIAPKGFYASRPADFFPGFVPAAVIADAQLVDAKAGPGDSAVIFRLDAKAIFLEPGSDGLDG